jgi:hypothetical protein
MKFLMISKFQVPVLLIFTKFDALEDKCYNRLRDEGKSHEEASIQVPGLAREIFQKEYLPRVLGAKFPPKAHICLKGIILHFYLFLKFLWILDMDKEENQCLELSEKTSHILDSDVLINLFVSTQKNNLDLCIQRGIECVFYFYWNFSILHSALIGVFGKKVVIFFI